jgi:hypothetical protein
VAVQRYQEAFHACCNMEWIRVPGTWVYLQHITTAECMTIPFHGIAIHSVFEDTPFKAVSRPRSVVLDIIDRGIAHCESWLERSKLIDGCTTDAWEEVNIDCQHQLTCLRSWRSELVLGRLRRSVATRSIQRQFRKVISDPSYDMCRRRLVREFGYLRAA